MVLPENVFSGVAKMEERQKQAAVAEQASRQNAGFSQAPFSQQNMFQSLHAQILYNIVYTLAQIKDTLKKFCDSIGQKQNKIKGLIRELSENYSEKSIKKLPSI